MSTWTVSDIHAGIKNVPGIEQSLTDSDFGSGADDEDECNIKYNPTNYSSSTEAQLSPRKMLLLMQCAAGELNQHITDIQQNIDQLKNVAKHNKSRINTMRTQLIDKIHAQANQLIKQSDAEVSKKQSVLNTERRNLKREHEQLVKAQSKFHAWMDNAHVSTQQRTLELHHIFVNVAHQVEYTSSVVPRVKFTLNKDATAHLLENLGYIHCFETPNKPVINVANITTSAVTFKCMNMNGSEAVHCEISTDEPMCISEWSEVEYENLRDNEFRVDQLPQNTRYKLRVRYANENGSSPRSEVQTFKTKNMALLIDTSARVLELPEKQILCALLNAQKKKFLFHKLKCIYSSVRHGFNVSRCHVRCQNKSNIMFIIHTNDGNVFGAFTQTLWITDNEQHQNDDHAFLFLLKSSQDKHRPRCFDIMCAESMAIWYNSSYFCLMGTGYDISVYKTCDKSEQYTYVSKGNFDVPSKYHMNADKRKFTVKHIEIFSCS